MPDLTENGLGSPEFDNTDTTNTTNDSTPTRRRRGRRVVRGAGEAGAQMQLEVHDRVPLFQEPSAAIEAGKPAKALPAGSHEEESEESEDSNEPTATRRRSRRASASTRSRSTRTANDEPEEPATTRSRRGRGAAQNDDEEPTVHTRRRSRAQADEAEEPRSTRSRRSRRTVSDESEQTNDDSYESRTQHVLDALDESFDDDAETHETGRGRLRSRSRSASRSRTSRREVLEDADQHESADVGNDEDESSARGNRRGGRPMTSLLFQEPVLPARSRSTHDEENDEDSDDEPLHDLDLNEGSTRSRKRSRNRRLNAQERRAAAEVEQIEEDLVLDDIVYAPIDDETGKSGDESDSEESGTHTRRRRRRKSQENANAEREESENEEGTRTRRRSRAEDDEENDESTVTRRRRRRRNSKGGEEEEQPRRSRKQQYIDEITDVEGSTRLEAKKQRRRDNRRERSRQNQLLEQDFLARRENVDRLMVVRERGRHTQISVIEDNVLVEHYVSDIQEVATVGNIYLGRVQNVLPSMEAAFVDIGQARNGVLYAGEVNWDATRLEGQPRRIELAFKSGDPVLVQVTKDPIGHKGARLTSQVTLAGRFLVLVPSGGMTGVSRKLSDRERNRLKSIVSKIAPKDMGVIIRTAAEGASEEAIAKDLEGLTNQWAEIQRKREEFLHGKRPKLLQGEPDVAIRVVRDVFNDDFNKMIVEGDGVYHRIEEYLDHMAPDLRNKLEKWDPEEHGGKDVFDKWQIDSQLRKGMERQVYLPSGGSIVIDRTEAMTTIDVNTGRFIGKGKSLEETVTRCNLEASEEIARQLRLRDIGGMVMIDYVDMVMPANRDLVLRRLVECLARDRTKHQVAEVTSLGLVQMTRKRIGQGLVEAFSEECPECKGRGFIVHDEPTISAEFDDPYAMKGGDPFVRTNKHGHGTPEVHAPKGSSAAVKAKLAQIAAAAVAANVAAEAEETVEAPAAETTEETAKVDVAVESTVESAADSAGNANGSEHVDGAVEQVEGEVIDDAEQSADDAAAVTVEDVAEES